MAVIYWPGGDWMIKREGKQGRERFGWKENRYRPLPPQFEQAQSADYWLDQMTPPVRTGTSKRACRLVRPKKLYDWKLKYIKQTFTQLTEWHAHKPTSKKTHTQPNTQLGRAVTECSTHPTVGKNNSHTTTYTANTDLHCIIGEKKIEICQIDWHYNAAFLFAIFKGCFFGCCI